MTNGTRNHYITSSNYVDHTRFGGLIYPSDFETDYRGDDNLKGSSIASRIISDMKFDEQCRRNLMVTEKRRNHNNINKGDN